MVTQQLLDYIKVQHQKGIFAGEIKKQLFEKGWQEEELNQAFSQLNIPLYISDPYQNNPKQVVYSNTHLAQEDSNLNVKPKTPLIFFIISFGLFLYGILIFLMPLVLFSFFLPFRSPIIGYITGFLGSTNLGLLPLFSGDQWINNATGSVSIVVLIRAISFLIIPFGLLGLKMWSLHLLTFITLLFCVAVTSRVFLFPFIPAYTGVGINIIISVIILIYLWTHYSLFNKPNILSPIIEKIFPNNRPLKILTISFIVLFLTVSFYLTITPQFNREAIQKFATYTISKGEKSPAKLVQKNIRGKILLKDVGSDKDGWGSWRSPLLMYDIQSKSIKTLKSDSYEGFGKSSFFLVSPDGKYIATTQTSNAFSVGKGFEKDPRDGEIALYLYSIEGDIFQKVFSEKTSSDDTNTEIDQVHWFPDTSSVMFTTNDKNAPYAHKVFRYDLDTNSLTQLLDTNSPGVEEISGYNSGIQIFFSNNKDVIYIVRPIRSQKIGEVAVSVYKKEASNSNLGKIIDLDITKSIDKGQVYVSTIKFSPNGDWLAFNVEDGYNLGYSLWIVNIERNTYQKIIKEKGTEKNIVHLVNPSLDGEKLLYYEYGYQGEDYEYYWVAPLKYPGKKQGQILLGECSRIYDEEDVYNNLQFALTTTSRKCLGSDTDQWNIFDLYNNTKVLEFDEDFANVINKKIPVGYWFSE